MNKLYIITILFPYHKSSSKVSAVCFDWWPNYKSIMRRKKFHSRAYYSPAERTPTIYSKLNGSEINAAICISIRTVSKAMEIYRQFYGSQMTNHVVVLVWIRRFTYFTRNMKWNPVRVEAIIQILFPIAKTENISFHFRTWWKDMAGAARVSLECKKKLLKSIFLSFQEKKNMKT